MAKREKVERRSADRATITYPVTLISGGQLNYTQTSNLSESGLFISDCCDLLVGQLVNLILTLPDQEVVSLPGEVCFVEPEIEAKAQRIAATGGKVRGKVWQLFPDKPYKIVFCEDPFGNIIELYSHSTEQTWSNQA